MDCTIRVAKTKALISIAVTAKLICVFVFAYAKNRFSHDEAHLIVGDNIISLKEINGMAPKIIYSCAPPETTDDDAPEETLLDESASKEETDA